MTGAMLSGEVSRDEGAIREAERKLKYIYTIETDLSGLVKEHGRGFEHLKVRVTTHTDDRARPRVDRGI